MSLQSIIFISLLLISLFANGSTDAPNAVTALVSSKCMQAQKALVITSAFNFIGLFISTILGGAVANTVRGTFLFNDLKTEKTILCISLLIVILWAFITYCFGFPSSESHALICALAGGAAASGASSFDPHLMSKTVIGFVISVLAGFIIGKLTMKAISGYSKTDLFYQRAQTVFCCAASFLHGAQDGQKFLALYTMYSPYSKINIYMLLIFCSVLASGSLCGGRKIIYTLGEKMTVLDKKQGFASDISSVICTFIPTVTGFPVSTSHIKSSTIVGVASKSADKKTVSELIFSWIITFPVCFGAGFLLTKIFL